MAVRLFSERSKKAGRLNPAKRRRLPYGISRTSVFSRSRQGTKYFRRRRISPPLSADPFETVEGTGGRAWKTAFYPREPKDHPHRGGDDFKKTCRRDRGSDAENRKRNCLKRRSHRRGHLHWGRGNRCHPHPRQNGPQASGEPSRDPPAHCQRRFGRRDGRPGQRAHRFRHPL